MTLKDTAARAAILKALHDAIGDELKAANAKLGSELKAAKESTGARQIGAELPDGTLVAKVSLVTPGPVAVVTDLSALREWVRQVCPTELTSRLVVEVREAFLTSLLKELTAAGVAKWCDKETGELHDVPGVQFQARASYQRLTFEKTGREQIAQAWQSGHLALPLALPAADESAA